jgi:hypothetical protein
MREGSTTARLGRLLLATLALAACKSAELGDHPPDPKMSPGTVTLRLLLPSTRSFCDQLQACQFSATHITLANTFGQPFQISTGFCPTFCSAQCTPQPCPGIACPIGGGVALTTSVEMTWDGSYYDSSTCGSGTTCYIPRFVAPGHYTAQMCATPGTLSDGDAAPPPTCTASGPQECVAVQFEIPGPTVEASLPEQVDPPPPPI